MTPRSSLQKWFGAAAACLLFFTMATPAVAEEPSDDQEVIVIGPVEPIAIDKTILDLPPAEGRLPDDRVRRTNPRHITFPEALLRPVPDFPLQPDPLLDLQLREPQRADRTFTTPDVNVAGIDPSCCPPDTVGEIGTTHFIQMVNGVGLGDGTTWQVFSRATGAAVAGPFTLEDLAPPGSACAGGDGDPIPLFDQLANRWVLTQFQTAPPDFALCFYLSSGADPTTSTWMLYEFITPGPSFPDYPKYAVWPNAYYAATNENPLRVYAMDRAKMLAGEEAEMIVRTVPPLAGFGFQIVPPVDLGGPNAPPAGSPGIFIRHVDDESHDGFPSPASDRLEIFEFTPDFTPPTSSTFTGPTSISVSEFSSDLCGLFSFECIPQPGTPQLLDPLREPVMQRPVYRNFGTHQSLIGSFATNVDAGAGDRAGIRWFELRRTAGTTAGGWSLFQEGTVSAADTLSRWMGSLAMDGEGNMALGYSTSGPSAGQFPSIRYTGRQVGDTPGTMPQVETEIIAGTASQTISERWGDYSAMTVDPVDDCTFWYTTEYMPSGNGGFPLTRIASFKFDSCAGCAADAFEPNNTSGQAGTVFSGTPQSHNICPAGDEDWMKLSLSFESGVVLETSGAAGDTQMTLYDSGLDQIDFDDDGGAGLFSRIERICDTDALAPGTYFVKVDEFGGDDEIAQYDVSFIATPCGTCQPEVTLANDTITGTQTFLTGNNATLGPDLTVNGVLIGVFAGNEVAVRNDVEIGGTFIAGHEPPCP